MLCNKSLLIVNATINLGEIEWWFDQLTSSVNEILPQGLTHNPQYLTGTQKPILHKITHGLGILWKPTL